jgi:hypothetical protein
VRRARSSGVGDLKTSSHTTGRTGQDGIAVPSTAAPDSPFGKAASAEEDVLMVLFKAGVRGAMRGTAESPCGSAHLSRRRVAAALRPAAGAPGVWVHSPAPISSVVPSTPWRSALARTAQAARPDAGVCAVPATSRDVFTPRPLRWSRSMNGAGVLGCALFTPCSGARSMLQGFGE